MRGSRWRDGAGSALERHPPSVVAQLPVTTVTGVRYKPLACSAVREAAASEHRRLGRK